MRCWSLPAISRRIQSPYPFIFNMIMIPFMFLFQPTSQNSRSSIDETIGQLLKSKNIWHQSLNIHSLRLEPRYVRSFLTIIRMLGHGWIITFHIIIPPTQRSWRGCTGFNLFACLSVRLWTESCPPCIFPNSRLIHFIFTHLIKQLQKMCSVYFFQNSQIWSFGEFFNFVTLTLSFFWVGIWING